LQSEHISRQHFLSIRVALDNLSAQSVLSAAVGLNCPLNQAILSSLRLTTCQDTISSRLQQNLTHLMLGTTSLWLLRNRPLFDTSLLLFAQITYLVLD